MTVRHLKIFIAVYEENNMTAAANKLFMTQPSVSQAIKELESKYEVVLFERLARKLYATGAGDNLYQYATHIIKLVDDMEDSLRGKAFKKKIFVGANYTIGSVLIQQYIGAFMTLHPNAEIRVVVNKSSVLKNMLRKNEIDLALIEEMISTADFVQEAFYDDRIAIVASPEHPLFSREVVTAQELAQEHLLLREKGAGVRDLFEARMNQQGFSVEPYWESTSTTALINAAKNKLGVAVLPFHLVEDPVAENSLKELHWRGMDLNRKLVIVYHKNKFLTGAMKAFIKICHAL